MSMRLVRGSVPHGTNAMTLLDAINLVNHYGTLPMCEEMRVIHKENKGIIEKELRSIMEYSQKQVLPVPPEYNTDIREFMEIYATRDGRVMDAIETTHNDMIDLDKESPKYKELEMRIKNLETNMFIPAFKDNQPIEGTFQYDDKDENAVKDLDALNLKHKKYLDAIKKQQKDMINYMQCEVKVHFKKAHKEILPDNYPPLMYIGEQWIDSDNIVLHPVIVKIFHYSVEIPVMEGVKGGKLVGLDGKELN